MRNIKQILDNLLTLLVKSTHADVQSDRWINLSEDKKEKIMKKVKAGVTEDKDFIVY